MNGPDPIKTSGQLISVDFTAAEEPLGLFAAWLAEAGTSEPNDPNAMALAIMLVARGMSRAAPLTLRSRSYGSLSEWISLMTGLPVWDEAEFVSSP